jgi:hypothetical protein
MNITVIVYNQGELTETFNFTVYCNQTAITLPNGENHTTVTLASAHVTTVAIAWNTTGFALGNYTISAYAEPLLGETDILDNNCTGDIVTVTIPGDVTGEGSCDMQDISLMIDWFMTTPPNWNPNCDVNGDLSIDMADISIAIDDFMTSGAPMTKAGILYDSGWIDVSHKAGQYFDVVHNLNSTGVIVDITGKTTADGGVHQKYFGGTDFVAGWNKTYGGTDADHSAALIVTGDGGYALAGATYSYGAGNSDAWLVKTDASGNMQWNKTYGGTNDEYFRGIVQTGDGGYALAGSTTSFGAGDADAWLVKTDSSGNAQWNKTYGGTNSDGPGSLVQTIDGGYALSGQSFGVSDADAWLVKTDASGNVQWTKTYGGTSTEGALALVETGDGGYALAGITDSFGAGGYDFWLVKTDAAGNAMDGFKYGLAWVDSSANSITLYRGTDDAYWNYVRVRVWKVKESP